MTKRHELKTWADPFRAVWDGTKTFEFRRDDRGFCEGDLLVLRELEEGSLDAYTGRAVEALVTYTVWGPDFGIPEGFVVMSIRVKARGWTTESLWGSKHKGGDDSG